MDEMREVFADFARIEERPGLGLSVPLGREDLSAELAMLQPGQAILLIEPDNLCAVGVAQYDDRDGHRYWYGVLAGWDAIQDIHPETLAEAERTKASASTE